MELKDIAVAFFWEIWSRIKILFRWISLRGTVSIEDIQRQNFVKFYEGYPDFYNSRTNEEKLALFRTMHSMLSEIPSLRQQGRIRILEIGAGSGANFKYYPESCNVIAIEPNQYFEKYFQDYLQQFPKIHLEKFIVAAAEDMSEVESGSVDAVVSTIVCCTVHDVQKVYKEVQRVLAPNGKFFYLEHVLEDSSSWMQYKQKLLTWLNIWQFLFDGCCLDRNLDCEVSKSGFSAVDQNRFSLTDTSGLWFLPFMKRHVSGVATR